MFLYDDLIQEYGVYFCPWPRLHPLTCRNGSQTRFDTGAILVNRFLIGFPIAGNPPYLMVVPEKYFILSWNTSFSEGQFVPSSIGVTNGGHHNQTSDIHTKGRKSDHVWSPGFNSEIARDAYNRCRHFWRKKLKCFKSLSAECMFSMLMALFGFSHAIQ